MQANN